MTVISSCGSFSSDDKNLELFHSSRDNPMQVICIKNNPRMHGFGKPLKVGDIITINGTISEGNTFMVSCPSETAFYDYTHFEPYGVSVAKPNLSSDEKCDLQVKINDDSFATIKFTWGKEPQNLEFKADGNVYHNDKQIGFDQELFKVMYKFFSLKDKPVNEYELTIVGDWNDADYVRESRKITSAELEKIKPIIEKISKWKDTSTYQQGHNWPSYNSTWDVIAEMHNLTQEEYFFIESYIPFGGDGIHTIESVTVKPWVEPTNLL